MLKQIKKTLQQYQNSERAKNPLFYKTGPGEYAQHDVFVGIATPDLRKVAKQYASLPLEEIQKLIESKINEERLLALLILVNRYQSENKSNKQIIYDFYLLNTRHVSNWNLVDASAHYIVGAHLLDKNKKILSQLVKSSCLWERRIAIVSTWYFIKRDMFDETIKLAEQLLQDEHDLIHKAVGWMLREVGKRDEKVLLAFLEKNHKKMPRTMLRYAIEKLTLQQKKQFLNSKN